MTDVPASVVIVGAGHAGGRLARQLRRYGFAGQIVLIGDEAHPPYERPALSKDFLTGKVDFEALVICTPDWCKGAGVDWRPQVRALSINRKCNQVRTTEGWLPYDVLVIATGSRPRLLETSGIDSSRLNLLRTRGDAERLHLQLQPGRRVFIVGGGLIGLEIASTARSLGCECEVVESSARFLSRTAPPDISAILCRYLESSHIPYTLGAGVDRVHGTEQGLSIELTTGDIRLADAIVVGIGATANSEIAIDAGLDVRDGILVDADGRTSDPAIFAIGDVARSIGTGFRLESWHNAEMQADRVAQMLARGSIDCPNEAPWYWTEQFGVNIQFVGSFDTDADVVWIGERGEGGSAAIYSLRNTVIGGVAFSHPRAFRQMRKWLAPGAKPLDLPEAVAALKHK